MKNQLELITDRASQLVIEKGINAMEAFELALKESTDLMYSLMDGSNLSKRGELACNELLNRYNAK